MTARRCAALALTCVALLGLACGRKTAVRPPDLVAPQSVEGVSAVNLDDGIEVRWQRPTRYVDGSHMLDLAAFRIERKRPCCGYRLLEHLEVEDRQRFRRKKTFRYLDSTADLGEIYHYRVIAITVDEYESLPGEAVFIRRALPSDDAADSPQS